MQHIYAASPAFLAELLTKSTKYNIIVLVY